MPISLPQSHCIFWFVAVKLYFLTILALWQRKTSPGPILSYLHSLFLQAAQRITNTIFLSQATLAHFNEVDYCMFVI